MSLTRKRMLGALWRPRGRRQENDAAETPIAGRDNRLRAEITDSSSAEADEAMIDAWCAEQLHPWTGRQIDKEQILHRYTHLNSISGALWLFKFSKNVVSLQKKPELGEQQAARAAWLAPRVASYHRFFQEVADIHPFKSEVYILVDVEDNPEDRGMLPIFSFQKGKQDDFILLPDIDALSADFYEANEYKDFNEFEDKICRGIFVGSTSGTLHTSDSVSKLSNPRLNSGVFFRLFDEVEFYLPNIVQCADEEARSAIQRLELGREMLPWSEQFRYKFILSLDGNGATCSRISVSLSSNSVLVKYASDRVLHYFSTLIPWRHYIPVKDNAEVLDIVRHEKDQPGAYDHIARAGREYFDKYLCGEYLRRYTFALVTRFGEILDTPHEPLTSNTFTYSIAHIWCIGEIAVNSGNHWIGRRGSRLPLQAFSFSMKEKGHPIAFQYRAFTKAKMPLEWQNSGQIAGSLESGFLLYGIEIRLNARFMQCCLGLLELNMITGQSLTIATTDGVALGITDEPIESFRFNVGRLF